MAAKSQGRSEVVSRKLRVHQRALMDGHVYIHDESQLSMARLSNISAGGFYAGDARSFLMGSEVRLVIKSPKLAEPVQAVGTIVRVEEGGFAVAFTSISPKYQHMIQRSVFECRMEETLRVSKG